VKTERERKGILREHERDGNLCSGLEQREGRECEKEIEF
jgi:hypothetical protein